MMILTLRILIVIVLLFLLTLCSNINQVQSKVDVTGKYRDQTENLTVELRQKEQQVTGTHCFVIQEGKRIDCCLSDEGASLKLKLDKQNIFTGIMTSCYDEESRNINILAIDNQLMLIIKENGHPFLPDTILLTRLPK